MFNILKRFRKSVKEEVKEVTLEASIKGCITDELNKGIIEKVIAEKLEECISSSLKDMFSWNGEVKKVIEEKVKSIMIPYLENYDYSEYITKLDSVLVEVLKSSTIENRKLLENFKELMTTDNTPKKIKVSKIFEEWSKYCEGEIDKDKIDMDCEGGYMTTSFEVEDLSEYRSDYKQIKITFECEEDENLKYEIFAHKWSWSNEFSIDSEGVKEISSLRYLNKFDMFLLRLSQGSFNLEIDLEEDSTETFIEYEG